MLTPDQLAARREIGASDVPVIMAGTPAQLLDKWREKIGLIPPMDFSNTWSVQLGNLCERFILDWHERKTGQPLVDRGRVFYHPTLEFLSCTLDAWRALDDCTLDAKVCGGWQPLDDIVAWYTPQAVVQRICKGAARCALLVMHGAAEPREIEIYSTPDYESKLFERVVAFQLCIETLTPPAPIPPIVPPEQWRTVNLGSLPVDQWPNWGKSLESQLKEWAYTKDYADQNKAAADAVKELIPMDVGTVQYFDLQVKRNRANALTIKRKSEK